MSFLGISQLSTAAYSPAWFLAGGAAASDSGGSSADPTEFAEACTGAADSLAASGLGGESVGGSGLLGGALGGAGGLGGLLGVVASLFGAGGAGGGGAPDGFAARLPGIARTIAGFLA